MHGGNLLEAMEKYGRDSFIDLSANINPFGPPEGVWDAIKVGLPKIIHYPDPEYRRLRKVMAEKYGLEENSIILGNGAGELLFAVLQALKPKKVLIPVPAFGEYERAALACQADIKKFTLGYKGWEADFLLKATTQELREIWSRLLGDTDLVFLNSPHNPTGSLLAKEHFELILKVAKELKVTVIMDESFIDFLEDGIRYTARNYLQDYPNLIVLYSLTKFYSIPGLRLGAVFASPEIIDKVKAQRDPWVVNILAEEAGIAALKDLEYPIRVRNLLKESKDYFLKAFSEVGFSKFILNPGYVNYSLIQLRDIQANMIVESLGREGVLVRNCSNFEGLEGEFIRVAIKDIPSMRALLEALKRIEKF